MSFAEVVLQAAVCLQILHQSVGLCNILSGHSRSDVGFFWTALGITSPVVSRQPFLWQPKHSRVVKASAEALMRELKP